jgi:hypothetical protein
MAKIKSQPPQRHFLDQMAVAFGQNEVGARPRRQLHNALTNENVILLDSCSQYFEGRG